MLADGAVSGERGMGKADARAGEFVLTDRDFRFIARTIGEHAGIVLSDVKRDMVYGRLVRRLRALGLRRFSDYCELLEQGDTAELEHFVNALTTNLTSFFREPHHFEYLRNEFLPRYIRERDGRRLRIWSAGCSTGEEAYSLAIVVAEVVPNDWDVRILATDLDTQVVRSAAGGCYAADRIAGIDERTRRRWFLRGKGLNEGLVRIRPELRELVTFRSLNLLDVWPMRGAFDIIFCRNVVIYFDKATQRLLFERFAEQMQPDGHLFIGHSETLYKVSDRFRLIGNTVYGRVT